MSDNRPLRATISALLLCLLVVALLTSSNLGGYPQVAHAAQPATSDRTITMSGYGEATAPPDVALVKLQVGEQAGYMPVAPGTPLFDEEDLAVLRDALQANGVAATNIITQPFSAAMGYNGSFLGEIRFVTTEPTTVSRLLKQLYETAEDNRGPQFQAATIAFAVNDCAALEEKALQAAVAKAKERATRAATLVGATVGDVISVKESGLYYGSGPTASCMAIEQALMARDPAAIAGAGTPTEVKVSAALEITFALGAFKE